MSPFDQLGFRGVTRKNLDPDVQADVRAWRNAILDHDPDSKHGLWVFGDRRAGTSYAAKAIAADLAFNHGLRDTVCVRALDMVDQIKGAWSISAQTRANSEDVGLYWDAQVAEDMLDIWFHRVEVLWIDDFHHETISMPMWKNHIQPRVEARLKDGRIVIISTTMSPDDSSLPKGVVPDLFTTVFCDGYRPDAGR